MDKPGSGQEPAQPEWKPLQSTDEMQGPYPNLVKNLKVLVNGLLFFGEL